MNLHKAAFGVCAALLVFAFVAAPHACEWGLNAYAAAGAAAALALFGAPLALASQLDGSRRVLHGLGYAAAAVAVWILGLFAADIRILCRLF